MANHNIMGAGHPRISFELDTFSWLQPAHYNLDEDYRAEKWAGSSLELWTIGQVEAARQTLGLIKDGLIMQAFSQSWRCSTAMHAIILCRISVGPLVDRVCRQEACV